jgi:hypothetical protein
VKFQRFIPCLFVALVAIGAVAVNAQTTATVTVNCNRGQSINKALSQPLNADILIVEIEGMCNENVVVTRDKVTLRGTSPTSDGIQAPANPMPTPRDAAVWVRGAQAVSIENLKLTGGSHGLVASDVSTPILRVVNSRLEGNVGFGALLFDSISQFQDTVITSNGGFSNVDLRASRFICVRCTFSNSLGGLNLVAGGGSVITINESSLTDGSVNIGDGSSGGINDSTIDARPSQPSLFVGQSQIILRRTQVGGPMRFFGGSNVLLFGVTQTRNENENLADEASFVKIGDASPASGGPPSIPSTILGFRLRTFSNGVLQQNSQLNGTLNCSEGANTFCANPANVSGASSCALCPKP